MIQDCKHQLVSFTDEKAECMECHLVWERYSIQLSSLITNIRPSTETEPTEVKQIP